MKSVPKLIKRFIGVLLLSTFLLLLLNAAVLLFVGLNQTSTVSPYQTANKIAKSLIKTKNGYSLKESLEYELSDKNIWAFFIDNDTHRTVWHTGNLPAEIPMSYSLSDIAKLSVGYLKDYPTYVGEGTDGIMVLGYPKDSFWKSLHPSWDYNFIANLPRTVLTAFLCNVLLIFIIYIAVTGRLIKSVNPIVKGIKGLSEKQPVSVNGKGVLSELAISINETSDTLQLQKRQLEKRETARANWIAGVSHDIRTPLAIVMGYAGQLEGDVRLTEEERKKATVILRQSERMRNLINDLNLASKLEYNMQPVNQAKENAVALVRRVAVDFLNTDIEDKYPVIWETGSELSSCMILADRELLKRAVSNLIQNSINHNEKGCDIFVSVRAEQENCIISVEDNGIGVSEEQIKRLNSTPHYMVCDENTTKQRHGLGLLIVKQITASHRGSTVIETSRHGGLAVRLKIPLLI